MLGSELRPRGTSRLCTPTKFISHLTEDPFSKCMKCNHPLSGITKLPKVIDDLSIVLNCGHVFCNKCVHMNDFATVNRGRPGHCQHDFQCGICGLMSPPLTVPNHVRICAQKYSPVINEDCKCEICLMKKSKNVEKRPSLNNIAFCGMHKEHIVKYFCLECGKHLCQACLEKFREDFLQRDHTLIDITKDNPKLEDALLHGSIIHNNLTTLEMDAKTSLDAFIKRSENLKNSMGCYFISIINAAIGRFCQIQSAIQLEEEKMRKTYEDVKKDVRDAKRRIEIGKEMDDLARNKKLMPEQFVADSYKMSAQKIFREAVKLHNRTIRDVKVIKSHTLQFSMRRQVDELVREVSHVFSAFTTTNTSVVVNYEIKPFTKLYSPGNQVIIDMPETNLKLKNSDFSTRNCVAKLREDGFSRFKSAVTACGLKNTDLSNLHATLIPLKLREKLMDNPRVDHQYLPLSIPDSTPNSSLSSPASRTSTLSSPALPKTDDRSKKQEELLHMIRGANGGSRNPAPINFQTPTPITTPIPIPIPVRDESKRKLIPNKKYANDVQPEQITITTRGSKYDRMTEKLMAGNSEASSSSASSSSLPKPGPSSSQPSTSKTGPKDPMNISISSEFMNKLYNSAQFKALSPDHQFYVLKQAQKLSEAEDQRRKNPNFNDTDHMVILQINQVRLQTLITKLFNVEKNAASATSKQIQSALKLPHAMTPDTISSLSTRSKPVAPDMASRRAPPPLPVRQQVPAAAAAPRVSGLLPQAPIKIEEDQEEEEVDVKPDVEKLKQQMQAASTVTLAEEEKPLLIEPPPVNGNEIVLMRPPPGVAAAQLAAEASASTRTMPTPTTPTKPAIQDGPDGRLILRLPRPTPKSSSSAGETPEHPDPPKPDSLLPTIDECKQAGALLPPTEEVIDDRESVRTLDDDGTHRWCYVCNDDKQDRLEEEKGICTTCPRVFHKSCTIPQLRVAWSEDENWQCIFCKTAPIKIEGESKTLMTPRNRFLCQTVLMKCFGTKRASYLMRSYADPEKTLEVVGHRLEEDHPMSFETVDEFIEALNNVLINASIHNSAASEKGKGTQKVWMLYRKAVKDHLPEFVGEVWLYISLYGCSLNKRRSATLRNQPPGKKRKTTP
ncbi:unnamed protein product [Caenorhabditis angaria]|uniref:RING-type domain-containing protein n=1 Tax=Caenorhabditis angaria TaxID=860376 RepID=A0A9P1N7H0_9PELO|nr:unnamed protein product [Caenorhabditis angaria]